MNKTFREELEKMLGKYFFVVDDVEDGKYFCMNKDGDSVPTNPFVEDITSPVERLIGEPEVITAYFRRYNQAPEDVEMWLSDAIEPITRNKFRTGGLREQVLKRDGYQCIICGTTQEAHLKEFGRSLTINHKNGLGRHALEGGVNPDNRLSNLETLCLRCHGHIDGLRSNRK